jgi:hypothetical protein
MNKGGRKRIAANIINANNTPSSSIFNTEDVKFTTRKPRTKVLCFCNKCDGKLVDPRTKKAHGQGQSTSLELLHSEQLTPLSTAIPSNEAQMSQVLIESFDSLENETYSTQIIPNIDMHKEQSFTFLLHKKGIKASTFRHITEIDELIESYSEELDKTTEYDTDDIHTGESSSEYSAQDEDTSFDVDDDEFLNEYENYSHPTFNFDTSEELPKEQQFTWILIWIMKFRSNYNIPDTATEALIKFVKFLLKEYGNIDHESFPNSLYMARKILGLVDRLVSFAACQKCHKLYKRNDILAQDKRSIMNCSHVEFPNLNTKRYKQCQTPLAKQITLNNRISALSELVYPIASI